MSVQTSLLFLCSPILRRCHTVLFLKNTVKCSYSGETGIGSGFGNCNFGGIHKIDRDTKTKAVYVIGKTDFKFMRKDPTNVADAEGKLFGKGFKGNRLCTVFQAVVHYFCDS